MIDVVRLEWALPGLRGELEGEIVERSADRVVVRAWAPPRLSAMEREAAVAERVRRGMREGRPTEPLLTFRLPDGQQIVDGPRGRPQPGGWRISAHSLAALHAPANTNGVARA